MSPVVDLTSDLIRFPSVSHRCNEDVAAFIQQRLDRLDFTTERVSYIDPAGVTKVSLVARRGKGVGGLAYFAHNDVVPVDDWQGPGSNDPFDPIIEGGRLYGRGSCDMKGSLAAMLIAAESVTATQQQAPLWIVVTADEETGFGGARNVVDQSQLYREMVEQQPVAVIGEPTSLDIVHAHKGIDGFRLTSRGKAGHSSSRDGVNATLPMISMLQLLKSIHERTQSDPTLQDSRFDPPDLSWNIGITGGGTAINVTPAKCQAWGSLRTMPGIDGSELVAQVQAKADELGIVFQRINGCGPMWIDPDAPFVREMVELTGSEKSKTVCYGTDAGIFNAFKQMVVCGPGDIAQAHTVDEWIDLQQLDRGVEVYRQVIQRWCCATSSRQA
ncbi:M20 family metallopeptidase [Rosistilla oblonga]|uniref:M20 family metallopeptidase n=1 Tax=Rosistilla oblonga TaxID=2527990 RepID=UPI003A97FE71